MPTLNISPEDLKTVKQILSEYAPGAEVWAYGSRITERHHEGSDLDLVLRNRSDLKKPWKNLATLKGVLIDSNLPMRVDILDWARIPEGFQREIDKTHVVVL